MKSLVFFRLQIAKATAYIGPPPQAFVTLRRSELQDQLEAEAGVDVCAIRIVFYFICCRRIWTKVSFTNA